MDIITKIKNTLINLYSKKMFRMLVAIIFLAFAFKHYSSIPKKIEKNPTAVDIFSVNGIKNKIEKETFLKQKKERELKEKILIKRKKEKINNINTDNIKSIPNNSTNTLSKAIGQATTNSKTVARNGDLVIIEMILFDEKITNVINKINEMPILINDDEKNVFAKYVKNKRVGYSTIIPISNVIPMDKGTPATKIAYKITIKNIKSMGKTN
ncbi:MAG: hypothetical protein PHY80_00960 [Rickettsiales bacterium]|nr:hypothetical protein [Rickettsiales bacterium]